MKYLFVHQNFPGQFVHIVRHLARRKRNDVVFISEPNANVIEGARKVAYRLPRPPAQGAHRAAVEFDLAMLRADLVAQTASNLKALGFTPDVIIGHHGWGEMLNLGDVWPDVPLIGYYEFYYRLTGADVGFDPEFPNDATDHPRIRAKNTVNLLALNQPGFGYTPTEWQLSTYPDWARKRITLLREGVDLDVCKPDAKARKAALDVAGVRIAPSDKLITFVSRDLEPYRGFHIMMRALPEMLAARPDLRVMLVGGEGVSYGAPAPRGSWREYLLAEVGAKLDLSRVHFAGRLDYNTYLSMMRRSDAHIYFSYPFVASWSLREALAMGCAVIGSATPTVEEFITDGRNGLLTPFFDTGALARRVLDLLEDKALDRKIRAGARRFAETNLRLEDHIEALEALIARATGG